MEVDIDGYVWEVSFIDITHGGMKMKESDGRPWVFHIGELSGKDYEPKVREFLRKADYLTKVIKESS